MITAWARQLVSVGLWGGVCAFFSLLMGTGGFALGFAMVVAILLFVVILLGPNVLASVLLVGSPTVFGFPNQILRPLPFVSMERLLLAILTGMVLMRIVFSHDKRLYLSSLEVLIVVFLSYAFASLVIHTSALTVTKDGWLFTQYAMPMVAFIVSRRIVWHEHGMRLLLGGLTVAGVFLAVVGVLQAVFGITFFTMDYQTVTSGHTERAFGTFSNSHTYVATVCILLVLTLLQLNTYRDALARFMLFSAMAAMLVGIVLGQTRAPWGGTAIALGVIFLRDRQIRPLLLTWAVVAAVIGTIVLMVKIDLLAALLGRLTDLGTMAGRLATWATAVNMIADHPLFGVGFGSASYALNKPDYITGVGALTAQYAVDLGVPHNEYLHVTVLLGITGLVLFLAILYHLIKLLFDTAARSEISPLRRRLALYVAAIVIGLLFNSMFSDTYMQDYFWLLTYFLAGVATGNPDRAEADRVRVAGPGQVP